MDLEIIIFSGSMLEFRTAFYVKTYLDSRDHCISNRLFSKKSQRILGGLLAAWHFLLPGGIKKELPVLVKGALDQSV